MAIVQPLLRVCWNGQAFRIFCMSPMAMKNGHVIGSKHVMKREEEPGEPAICIVLSLGANKGTALAGNDTTGACIFRSGKRSVEHELLYVQMNQRVHFPYYL